MLLSLIVPFMTHCSAITFLKMARTLLCCVLLLHSLNLSSVHSSTVLHFSLMVSGVNVTLIQPAVQKAVDQINNNTSILPDYQLQYSIHWTSECSTKSSLDNFFTSVNSDETILAVIGCGCSSATEQVAKISSYWNISMISYASSSDVLSDRSTYCNFFRTVPSDSLLPSLLVTTMNYYGWRQLAVVTEQQPQYLQLHTRLRRHFETENVSLTSFQFVSSINFHEFSRTMADLMGSEPHIFLLNMNSHWAAIFICSAYHNGRVYPNYGWILHGLYDDQWWTVDDVSAVNCSKEQLLQALDRMIVITAATETSSDPVETTDPMVSRYAADAVMALALSLNTTASDITNSDLSRHQCSGTSGSILPLHNFTYENSNMSCLMMNNLANVSFHGKSGWVEFDSQGNRISKQIGYLTQYRYVDHVHYKVSVADISNVDDFTYYANESNSSVWPEGIPPDGVPMMVIHTLWPAVYGTAFSFAGIGIVYSFVCFLFVLIFRNNKVIKLTSPNLNYFIIIGTIFYSIAIILFAIPTTNPEVVKQLCWLRQPFINTGDDFVFSVILVKTWRVYYLFRKPSLDKKPPTDFKLLLAVLLIVGISLIIYVTIAVPHTLTTFVDILRSPEEPALPNDLGVVEIPYFINCQRSLYFTAYVIIRFLVKFGLHVIAGVLSFLTRKVKVNSLNEFRYISIYIYISSLLLIAFGCVVVAVEKIPNLYIMSVTTILFISTLLPLSLIFVPKMVYLYKDPTGEHAFENTKTQYSQQ